MRFGAELILAKMDWQGRGREKQTSRMVLKDWKGETEVINTQRLYRGYKI
jgi:hypothetical protein